MSRNTKQPIQFYRGTTAQHSGYMGPAGECTVDTTKNTLVVHDGVKAGGYPLVKEDHPVTGDGLIKVNGGTSTVLGSGALALSIDTAAVGAAVSPVATDTVLGINKLSDATDSTLDVSGQTAATPAAVKAAYDKAEEAITASRTLASIDSPGVVQIGDNLSIDRYGVLRVDTSAYNVYLDGVNGLDTNDGLTADTPVKTVTRAFHCFSGVSRYNPQPHIMYVAAGTYTDATFSINGMIHPPMVVNFAPGARVISNVVAIYGGQAVISGSLTIDNTGFDIKQHDVAIGARQSGKLFIINLNAVIRGNFKYALYSGDVSIVYDYSNPYDDTENSGNTIHFDYVSSTEGTAVCVYSSFIDLIRTTCTGIATGRRYHCALLSNIVVHSRGDGEGFFPGSDAGLVEDNSLYNLYNE